MHLNREQKNGFFFHAMLKNLLSITMSATVVLVLLDGETMSFSSKDDRMIF